METAIVILSIFLFAAVIGNVLLFHQNMKLKRQLPAADVPAKQRKNVYTYLAIGNSITLHGKCSYWWDDRRGMASTEPEKDFVHLVAAYLKKQHEDVSFSAFNFSVWEVQAKDRAETLPMLEKYFTGTPDLITVQLSENVRDHSTFAQDFMELLQWIKAKAPRAKILVIGDYWSEETTKVKHEAAEKCDCGFVDLTPMIGKEEYTCPVGTMVKDDQGGDHRVEHAGVAAHPGDKGMQFIADMIIRQFQA